MIECHELAVAYSKQDRIVYIMEDKKQTISYDKNEMHNEYTNK